MIGTKIAKPMKSIKLEKVKYYSSTNSINESKHKIKSQSDKAPKKTDFFRLPKLTF